MMNFRPYEISVSNTKTTERVVIKLEFGGSEELYRYLAPLVHAWATGKEIEPLKIVPQTSHLDSLADKVDEIDSALDKVLEKLRTTRL